LSTPVAVDRERPPLLGRKRELALIDDFLGNAGTRGRALLVRGDAGIGKSALLDEATRRAAERGMPVLSTSGAAFETRMPFAGLHRLLHPLLPQIDTLPAPQRDALAAAFGLTDQRAPDLFLIALAGLELLSERAGEAPLLLVVEDAHWLDPASCEVLAFIARRVELEPIIVLVASRDEPASRVAELGLPELRLDALDQESAVTLLDTHARGLAPDLRERLLDDAAGNPLALVELSNALDSEEPVGALAATAPLPITERLERAFAGRAAELPPETRLLLLLAALDEGADLRATLEAASLVDGHTPSADDFSLAEAAGLITVDGEVVRFRHPLVRAAIYHSAAAAQRRAAHRALAQTHGDDADRQVWHRAGALIGPDDEVAADLELAAERAVQRGAPAAAASALERAAQLSETSSNHGRRLVRAAEIELELGRTQLALNQLAEAKPLELDHEDRMRLTFLLEASDEDSWSGASRVGAFAELANEMAAAGGPALLLRSLVPVAIGCWWGNPTQQTRDLVVEAAERLRADPDDPSLLAVLACADPLKRGKVVIERIRRIPPDATRDPVELHLIGTAATAVWAFDLSWSFLGAAVDGLRSQGRLGLLAQALVSQAWAAIHLAKETHAMAAADEAARLARETGQSRWAVAADLAKATIAGERGDAKTAHALADRAEAELLPIGAQAVLSLVRFARGRYAVAHHRHAEGLEQLARILDPSDVAYHPFTGAWALADLVEAAAHAGKLDLAHAYLEHLESLAAQTSAPYLRASAAYARPLLATDDGAEAHYQAALEHELSSWPCYRGRLLLHYGRWLRRQRRVAESRAPLRAARESFDALAFDGLAETARQELRASGETSGRRTPDARDQLTPQELQIAQLAATGLSNREIGQRLYLSHRTVGSHLYRIFPKLGIRSRSELGGALAAQA
jgi:DNA-binding CsgD family transcriptional regulator